MIGGLLTSVQPCEWCTLGGETNCELPHLAHSRHDGHTACPLRAKSRRW